MIRVKICGVTNAADARAACEAGANLVGLNFFKGSPRHITSAAAKIRCELPPDVEAVGIFVNASPATVSEVCTSLKLSAAQLHGDESAHSVAEISKEVPVIKAFRVHANFSLETLDEYSGAFAFLLDAAEAGQYGGTGHTADWALARRAAESRRIILAGGLKVENVAAAIRLVRPYGVDVASGVESRPGKKDHGRVREFIQEVRRVEKQLEARLENAQEA